MSFGDANKHLINVTCLGNETMLKFAVFQELEQVEGVKNYSIEVDYEKVTLDDLGKYELVFVVNDEYGSN